MPIHLNKLKGKGSVNQIPFLAKSSTEKGSVSTSRLKVKPNVLWRSRIENLSLLDTKCLDNAQPQPRQRYRTAVKRKTRMQSKVLLIRLKCDRYTHEEWRLTEMSLYSDCLGRNAECLGISGATPTLGTKFLLK
jgi:hypothetical protein